MSKINVHVFNTCTSAREMLLEFSEGDPLTKLERHYDKDVRNEVKKLRKLGVVQARKWAKGHFKYIDPLGQIIISGLKEIISDEKMVKEGKGSKLRRIKIGND